MAKGKKAEKDPHSFSDFAPANGAWYAIHDLDDMILLHRVTGWMTHYNGDKCVGVTPCNEMGSPMLEWGTNAIAAIAGEDKGPNGMTWADIYNSAPYKYGNVGKDITALLRDEGG